MSQMNNANTPNTQLSIAGTEPAAANSPENIQSYHSNVFPFDECVGFMNRVGKHLFGEHFRIYAEDHPIIFKLLVYFSLDKENGARYGIDHRKGIMLAGPIGVGKTSLMTIMNYFNPTLQYTIKPCREIAIDFCKEGFDVIDKYGKSSFAIMRGETRPRAYCFDDLGTEKNMTYFGNDTNVLAEILFARYDKFISSGMLTHVTTNLTAQALEKRYGKRIRSRMRQQFNLIAFPEGAKDKRS